MQYFSPIHTSESLIESEDTIIWNFNLLTATEFGNS